MKTEFPRSAAVSAVLLLALSDPAWSQDSAADRDRIHGDEHRHDDIEEVIVRATPLERDLVELSQSATVLSGASLEREVANNLGETLTRLPGLANASFGQNVGRPVIRGLQGQRVGVLENNMASSDASAVSQDHAVSVEPFLADQIEVLRGPSTLLYGSGSIGGVVNIVTHTIPETLPEGGWSGRALGQVDSAADQRFAAGRLDLGASRFALHADAFYRRSDDYDIPGLAELYPEDDDHEEAPGDEAGHDDEVASGTLPNSFLDNQGGALGASWIGERWRAGVSWTAYDSDYGIPGAGHHDEGVGEDEEGFVTIGLESRRWDGEIVGTDPFGGIEQLKFRFARTDYTHTEFEGEEVGTVFDSVTDDARLELRHGLWERSDGALGAQFTDIDFGAIGEEAFVPSSRTRTRALFWVENAEFTQWNLEAGLRYEDISVRIDETGLPDGDSHEGGPDRPGTGDDRGNYEPFSISFGLVRHLTDESHLALTLARAERAPNAQELFAYGPHVASQTFEVGNPALDTEKNLHAELGYRLHGGRLTGSATLYVDRFSDYIYQANSGTEADDLPVRLWSQQDARFVGGEIELRYDLGRFASGHWQVFGFLDTVRAKLDDGQRVPLMPPARLGLGTDWDRGNWAGSLLWIHAADHDRVADFETPTPGYNLLNAELSWMLPGQGQVEWQLFLKASNLLDEDIRNSTSYLKDQAPQAGRNFVLGLRVAR